ncbi:MAG: hypothetical protein DYG88_18300 [Chloroflexi bacterium CFX4]|nr:hypothetical protein [Chloroflexi bacterium CFX4]MDL1924516.1 hypothetical protein [Chloroflexi bacterium CFX3]
MLTLLIALLGFFAALPINLLADYLPARRYDQLARRNPFTSQHSLPPVPPLIPRVPLFLWFGITALLLGKPTTRTARRVAVELGLSLAFGLLAHTYGLIGEVVFYYIYAALFVLIAVIDIEHRWVLPSTLITLAGCGVLEWLLFGWRIAPSEMLRGAVNGVGLGVCLWLLGLAYGRLKRAVRGKAVGRTIFGVGDVWLLGACGVLIGGEYILFALLIMMLSGGVAAFSTLIFRIVRLGKHARRRGSLAIPYAPHILIGTAFWLYAPTAATLLLRGLVSAL